METILISIITVFLLIGLFVLFSDPYAILGGNLNKKRLPFYTWYHYNYLKHFKNIELALLGSSALNYYAVDSLNGVNAKSIFVMGVESSNITEHLAYGRLLFAKKPKEIIFFYTFYALNPSRGFQLEFKPRMLAKNNKIFDLFYQYCNLRAIKDAGMSLLESIGLKQKRRHLFFSNGLRTQRHYLDRDNYSFDDVISDYLVAMSIDPHYYNSDAFKNPESIIAGFEKIKQFKADAEKRNIKLRFVATPVYRETIALIYSIGLGNTYERYRQEMVKIAPYQDLNLDRVLTDNPENWWDSHHTRNGAYVQQLLNQKRYLVTHANVSETTVELRPSDEEIRHVNQRLERYKNWPMMRSKIAERLKKVPPLC